MEQLFLYFLEKSLNSILVILIVVVIRLMLQKVPKIFSYLLWVTVFLYLIVPAFIKTTFQKLPVHSFTDSVTSRTNMYDTITNPYHTITASPKSLAGFPSALTIMTVLWLLGILALFVYNFTGYATLRKELKGAPCIGYMVFQSERLRTPFVFGILHPKIYLPASLDEKNIEFILSHEKVHIRRGDYLIKPAACLILILHWYNPFVWLAYYLMCKDMEMSCDEAAISQLNLEKRKEYAMTLLSLSTQHSARIPVGFSKNNVAERVKNVVKIKKISLFISIILAAALIIFGIYLFSASAKPTTATVNVTTLYVRSAPEEDAPIVTMLAEGTTAKIIEQLDNGFTKIEYEGTTAYVMSQYIDIE